MDDSDRHEYENMRLLWLWEQSYYQGGDSEFRDDKDYQAWAEDRRKQDKDFQMEDE